MAQKTIPELAESTNPDVNATFLPIDDGIQTKKLRLSELLKTQTMYRPDFTQTGGTIDIFQCLVVVDKYVDADSNEWFIADMNISFTYDPAWSGSHSGITVTIEGIEFDAIQGSPMISHVRHGSGTDEASFTQAQAGANTIVIQHESVSGILGYSIQGRVNLQAEPEFYTESGLRMVGARFADNVLRSEIEAATPDYVVINGPDGRLSEEEFLSPVRGGLGASAGSATGYPRFTSGVVSFVDTPAESELSTGLKFGGAVTGLGASTINVAAGAGVIISSVDPENPEVIPVSWDAETGVTVLAGVNYVYVNFEGTIVVTSTAQEGPGYRNFIQLARVSVNGGVVTGISSTVMPYSQSTPQLWDLFEAIGILKSGLVVSAGSTNLTLAIGAGSIYAPGVNFHTDPLNPHRKPFSSFNSNGADRFRMTLNTGVVGSDIAALDVGNYNVAGVVTAIPGASTRATIFTVYRFPSGNVRVLYGTEYYNTIDDAFEALGAYTPAPPASFSEAIIIGFVIATKGATNLSDVASGKFVETNKFGGVAGAIATGNSVQWGEITGTLADQTDLQAAFDAIGDITPDTVTALPATLLTNTAYKVAQSATTNAALPVTSLASTISVTDATGNCSATNEIGITAGSGQSIRYRGQLISGSDRFVMRRANVDVTFSKEAGATIWEVDYQTIAVPQGGQLPGSPGIAFPGVNFLSEPKASLSGVVIPTNNVWFDVTSVTVTPGIYWVSAGINVRGNGATWTARDWACGIAYASGTGTTGLRLGLSQFEINDNQTFSQMRANFPIPGFLLRYDGSNFYFVDGTSYASVSGTIYLKGFIGVFSAGSPQVVGSLNVARL